MTTDLLALPAGVLITLGILVVAVLLLDVVALTDLYRRPTELVAFGNKWIWLVLILLLSFLGPVLYLLAGRKTPSPAETPAAARSHSKKAGASDVVDNLYGPPDHPSRR